jgi:Fe-S-cluster containining protein
MREAMCLEPILDFESFERAVREEIERAGVSLVIATYRVLDREDEKARAEAACGEGCFLCCNQMVCCTREEMDEIIKFIDYLPWQKRRPLMARLKTFANRWYQYHSKWRQLIDSGLRDPTEDWFGQACPFLEKTGICAIYPVRPLDCRARLSLAVCKTTKEPSCFRSMHSGFATAVICEATGTVNGVPPIHYWLAYHILQSRTLK